MINFQKSIFLYYRGAKAHKFFIISGLGFIFANIRGRFAGKGVFEFKRVRFSFLPYILISLAKWFFEECTPNEVEGINNVYPH